MELGHVASELEIGNEPGPRLLRQSNGIADVVEVTVGEQNVIDLFKSVERIFFFLCIRIDRVLQPGIDHHHRSAGGHNLKRRMAVPGQPGLRSPGGPHKQ